MTPTDYIAFVLIYSACAATIFLIATKHQWILYLRLNGKFGINKIADCTLCTCFWLCAFLAVAGWIAGAPLETLSTPIVGASITRAVIN